MTRRGSHMSVFPPQQGCYSDIKTKPCSISEGHDLCTQPGLCHPGSKHRTSPTRIAVRPHSRSPVRSPSRYHHHAAESHREQQNGTTSGAAAPRPDDVGHIVPAESERTASSGRTQPTLEATVNSAAAGEGVDSRREADSSSEGQKLSRAGSPEDDGAVSVAGAAHPRRDVRRGRHVKFTPRWMLRIPALMAGEETLPGIVGHCIAMQCHR